MSEIFRSCCGSSPSEPHRPDCHNFKGTPASQTGVSEKRRDQVQLTPAQTVAKLRKIAADYDLATMDTKALSQIAALIEAQEAGAAVMREILLDIKNVMVLSPNGLNMSGAVTKVISDEIDHSLSPTAGAALLDVVRAADELHQSLDDPLVPSADYMQRDISVKKWRKLGVALAAYRGGSADHG